MDTRDGSLAKLTGGDPVFLICDYLELMAELGRTELSSGKNALTVWAETLGIDWPLAPSLFSSTSAVESSTRPVRRLQ